MRLLPVVGRFFSFWLSGVKGASPNTSKNYRDAFSLLLPFVARSVQRRFAAASMDAMRRAVVE